MATTAGPFGSRRTSSSFRPSSAGSFTLETTRPITLPRYIPLLILRNLVDDADDCRIDRCVLAAVSHPGRASLNNQHLLAETRMDGIHRDQVALFVVPIRVDGPADQQLFSLQPGILPRRDDGADNTREHHGRRLPRGLSD